MKIFDTVSRFLLILGILVSFQIFSQEQEKYIPFRKGKLWGLCNANKFIVVQPQYNSISWYDSSVGGFHVQKNSKFGIIDSNATPVMPFISEEPITVINDNYVVFDGFGYYNYSMTTKMRLDPFVQHDAFPVNDRWNRGEDPFFDDNNFKLAILQWTDLDEDDVLMLKPYEDKSVYQIIFKYNFLEIVSKDAQIGIYIPKIKKLYKNTPELAYVGWQFYNQKPYILTTNSSQLFGMANEFSHEIFPVKYVSIEMSDIEKLIFLSEPDPKNPENLIFKTILPNNKILNGKFLPHGIVTRHGHTFKLYYTMINGEKNYAGEDGTLYFEG
ncbi:hypothetical protein [Chryseobacterium indoltheticum]|uniref:hypothetical protein n=1 Tax=Chryseobacterium indoltheticum TaxID=254 RepID=UPI0040413C5C